MGSSILHSFNPANHGSDTGSSILQSFNPVNHGQNQDQS